MREEFLHYLWKYRLLKSPLSTTDGEAVEVISPGVHNLDAGPDFLNARLRIGENLWAGNVEIHVRASSWYEHGHNTDKAYDNVILHVVLDNDRPVFRTDGNILPCLECDDLIPDKLFEKYKDLMGSKLWIPCARIIRFCPQIVVTSAIENQMIERLTLKSSAIGEVWNSVGNNWEETFYRLLARSFGLKINVLPFEMLAASLPHKIISRHHDQSLQLAAMIFGQAGFLEEEFTDEYPSQLKSEYDFLRGKYSLQPIDASIWKFMRLRPKAFPTIRLAQFSAIMEKSPSLFSHILENNDPKALFDLFRASINSYWHDHYRFDAKSKEKSDKSLGEETINLILINAVAPMLFLYGMQNQSDTFKNRAFSLLESLPAEKNSIISKWKSLGIDVKDAFTSQALLNLKHNYCDRKRCLDCRIGNELIK